LKSVKEMGALKGQHPLPENQSAQPQKIHTYKKKSPNQVIEWTE
jgi:hypothetical protein